MKIWIFVLVFVVSPFSFSCDDLSEVTPHEPPHSAEAIDYALRETGRNSFESTRDSGSSNVDYPSGGYGGGSEP